MNEGDFHAREAPTGLPSNDAVPQVPRVGFRRAVLLAGAAVALAAAAASAMGLLPPWFAGARQDRRHVTPGFYALEKRLGYPLYALTRVPPSLSLHPEEEPTTGARRVMLAYLNQNAELGVILAQERANPERDAYMQQTFVRNPERQVSVHGRPAYFVNGTTGDRRLYWRDADRHLILSGSNFPDDLLVELAEGVQCGPASSAPAPH